MDMAALAAYKPHAETLAPVASVADGPIRLLVAAKIGTTRLIDNIPV